MDSSKLIKAVTKVTGVWAKQRKAEERRASALSRRSYAFTPYRYTAKDAAWEIMETAYMKTSAHNTLPAHARQIMYATRGYIQDKTDKPLDDVYFTQTLLPDYINANPIKTADWDVVFDARGNLLEPHTGEELPLGTLQVRGYLRDATLSLSTDYELNYSPPILCATRGPHHRYQAILFIEKEGFMPLFKKVRLAERYDIAIMSTKGLNTTAARTLVDKLCSATPLYVLHDFDKSGFSIVGTLKRDTRRYSFNRRPNVIDLGLRLADVGANNLDPEAVSYGNSDPARNLRENGAIQEEIEFLRSQRVELNAFPSDLLVKWIEEKLEQQGLQKLVPDDVVLKQAYRRAVAIKYVKEKLGALNEEAEKIGKDATIPQGLRVMVMEELDKDRAIPWDEALYNELIASKH